MTGRSTTPMQTNVRRAVLFAHPFNSRIQLTAGGGSALPSFPKADFPNVKQLARLAPTGGWADGTPACRLLDLLAGAHRGV